MTRHYNVRGPFLFLHVNLLDNRSEFQAPLEVTLRKEGEDYVGEVHGAIAIANTIAYVSEAIDPISVFIGLTRRELMGHDPPALLGVDAGGGRAAAHLPDERLSTRRRIDVQRGREGPRRSVPRTLQDLRVRGQRGDQGRGSCVTHGSGQGSRRTEGIMGRQRLAAGLGIAFLLGLGPGAPASRAAEKPPAPLAYKTVRGKLDTVDQSLNGVVVLSDEGRRMAWRFDKAVITQLAAFKRGDPVVVIYRQQGTDKSVTAIAFPGAEATPVYVNMTGERVELVSGPMVGGTCRQPADDAPLHTTTLPIGGRADTSDACFCCAPAGQTCSPTSKTGPGRAFLTRCYE
jgi:hypothetical protein